MGRSRIGTNEQVGLPQQAGKFSDGQPPGQIRDARPRLITEDVLGDYTVLVASDQHDLGLVIDQKPTDQFSPMRSWPTFGRCTGTHMKGNLRGMAVQVGVWSIFRPLDLAVAERRGPKTWT